MPLEGGVSTEGEIKAEKKNRGKGGDHPKALGKGFQLIVLRGTAQQTQIKTTQRKEGRKIEVVGGVHPVLRG